MVGERWNTEKPKSLKRRVAETAEMETRSRSRQSSGFIVEPLSSTAPAVSTKRPSIAPHCLAAVASNQAPRPLNHQPSPASQIRRGGLSAFSSASISVHQRFPGCSLSASPREPRLFAPNVQIDLTNLLPGRILHIMNHQKSGGFLSRS